MENTEIEVSIFCITYNQVEYIELAIQSFLLQETNFRYEILIHDDASTDGTAEILKRYEKLFPEQIEVIYQSENQYSQGKPVSENLFNIARGKYIAVCEGDDFWISNDKLQVQYDFLEKNQQYSLCVHSGLNVYANGRPMRELFRPFIENRTVKTEDVINKWLFPTASIFYRKDARVPYQIPFSKNAPCGDYPLVVYLSLKGRIYYIDRAMCAYRRDSKNSLSKKMSGDVKKLITFYEKFNFMLAEINEYTNNGYQEILTRMIEKYTCLIFLFTGDLKSVFANAHFKRINLFKKVTYILYCLFPSTSRLFIRIIRDVRNIKFKSYKYIAKPIEEFLVDMEKKNPNLCCVDYPNSQKIITTDV